MPGPDQRPLAMLVNGEPVGCIDACDRGIQYGDGLFSTLAVRSGSPCLWQRHLQRLETGCSRLGIPLPKPSLLRAEADRLASTLHRAVIKIILTRGTGGRGYRPPEVPAPTRILMAFPWPGYPDNWYCEGVKIRLCRTTLGRNPQLAGIKHLNRLEQVLARAEWSDASIAEGLMNDSAGQLVGGTMTNLMLLREGGLLTPELSQCGVRGVMRDLLMEQLPALGYRVETGSITRDSLMDAEAVFLSNSLIGLWPVREIEGRGFPISAEVRRLVDFAHKAAYGA